MNLHDPPVRFVCQATIAAAATVMLLLGALAFYTVVDWSMNNGEGSDNSTLEVAYSLLPNREDMNDGWLTGVAAIFLNAAPLAVTSVCFTNANARRLNRFGQTVLVILFLTIVLSMLGYLLIKPSEWALGHILTDVGLAGVRDWAKVAAQSAAFYIATLIGLKVSS